MFCIKKFSLTSPSVVGLSTLELEETQGEYFLSSHFLLSFVLNLACLLFIYYLITEKKDLKWFPVYTWDKQETNK